MRPEAKDGGRPEWGKKMMFLFRPTNLLSLSLSAFIMDSGLTAGAVRTWDTEEGYDDSSSCLQVGVLSCK